MTTFAATAAPAGANLANGPPTCQNCSTSTTPLWRRDEAGSVLCNACGLFLKLHGRPRPISLKTDVIKSRNRVKGTGQGAKKRQSGDTNGLPASHPDASAPPPDPSLHQRRASVKIPSGHSDRSTSPISRTGTPGIHSNPNIAPQHMFDGVTLGAHDFHSPSIPAFTLRHPSPGSTSSINGSHLGPPLSYDEMKTRVSELEVINDLFRGRVSELEASEQEARRNEMLAREREMDLRRRVEELEAELGIGEDGSRKRVRLSDVVHESRATTPTP